MNLEQILSFISSDQILTTLGYIFILAILISILIFVIAIIIIAYNHKVILDTWKLIKVLPAEFDKLKIQIHDASQTADSINTFLGDSWPKIESHIIDLNSDRRMSIKKIMDFEATAVLSKEFTSEQIATLNSVFAHNLKSLTNKENKPMESKINYIANYLLELGDRLKKIEELIGNVSLPITERPTVIAQNTISNGIDSYKTLATGSLMPTAEPAPLAADTIQMRAVSRTDAFPLSGVGTAKIPDTEKLKTVAESGHTDISLADTQVNQPVYETVKQQKVILKK